MGGQYYRTGSNANEIGKRIQQVNAAWCEMGNFWHSDAPFAAKRNAFIGSIQGAALAGMTSYVLTDAEKRQLDTKLVGLLRSMMKGAAYNETDGVALRNSQVYAHWRLLPIDLELRVREVRWLQKLCLGGSAHCQVIGALFGRSHVGVRVIYDALDKHGRLAGTASPYAFKLINNLDFFEPLETAREFFLCWKSAGYSIRSLLSDDV